MIASKPGFSSRLNSSATVVVTITTVVEVVVLVEVDCYISDLLLMLRKKSCDSCLTLIQDALYLLINQ